MRKQKCRPERLIDTDPSITSRDLKTISKQCDNKIKTKTKEKLSGNIKLKRIKTMKTINHKLKLLLSIKNYKKFEN